MTAPLPGNPYREIADELAGNLHLMAADVAPADAIANCLLVNAQATLALAHEQHQRNRLAAITALHRGLDLPADLEDLAREGTR